MSPFTRWKQRCCQHSLLHVFLDVPRAVAAAVVPEKVSLVSDLEELERDAGVLHVGGSKGGVQRTRIESGRGDVV